MNVLIEWYLKLNAAVRWSNCLSYYFRIRSGVRQGGIMSPYCFNCYIDPLIQALKESGFGCSFRRDYAGYILFADEILLLPASVSKLQGMLSLCYEFLIQRELSFNCKKGYVCCFGSKLPPPCKLVLGNCTINWCISFKYLGVIILGGRNLTVDIDFNRKKFLSTAYGLFHKIEGLSEEIQCQLIISQCLPILLSGLECFLLSFRQLQKIFVALNCVFRRIFSLHKWTSVRDLLFFAGIYPSTVLIEELQLLLLHNCFR